VIIFDKFGDGRSKRKRSVRVCAATVATDSLDFLHARGFIRSALRLQRPRHISNRELDLLERHLSHCKQRTANVPNRELSANQCSCNLQVPDSLGGLRITDHATRFVCDRIAISLRGTRIAGRGTRRSAPFLTGSAPQTEFVVTPSKQTTDEFLTGSRTAIKVSHFRPEFRTESQHQRVPECCSPDAAEQSKIPLNIRIEKELL